MLFRSEEAGGTYGSRYLVAKHPEIFADCTEAVSEVGGFSVTLRNGKRLYLIEGAQKGIHWIRITAKGTAGHGSFVNKDNAVTKISSSVEKIGNYEWPQRYTRTVRELFTAIAEATGQQLGEDFRPLLIEIGSAARMIGATLQNTSNPTQLNAGYKIGRAHV